jgi:hypothetical protein
MATGGNRAGGMADQNGELVERFSTIMHNLGLARAGDELVTMLRSKRWRKWSQGGLDFEFLPGEFDYFLTQQDIQRDEVLAIPDVEVKATLEEAMDERRTGEARYRRRIEQVRAEVPELPGRQISPYGYTQAEANTLVKMGATVRSTRLPALGNSVRRFANTGGQTTKPPSEERPRWERLAASVVRLPDNELELLLERVKAERVARRQQARRSPGAH